MVETNRFIPEPKRDVLFSQQELKVEAVAQAKVEELPDVETLHHHDPLGIYIGNSYL